MNDAPTSLLETDTLLMRLRERVEDPIQRNDPLIQDLSLLLKRHDKLVKRLNKIISISDSYQSIIRDFTAKMEHLARTDYLTGLFNRGAMMERLEYEITRAERYQRVFSTALLDVDDFKQINDTLGHIAGDEVLKRVANELKRSIRCSDACARWGGEEFLILFPETCLHDACQASDKLRISIFNQRINVENETISLSICGGVSVYRPGMNVNDLLKQADDALYRAKSSGKNRIVCCA